MTDYSYRDLFDRRKEKRAGEPDRMSGDLAFSGFALGVSASFVGLFYRSDFFFGSANHHGSEGGRFCQRLGVLVFIRGTPVSSRKSNIARAAEYNNNQAFSGSSAAQTRFCRVGDSLLLPNPGGRPHDVGG